jgi:hypothetical protein
MKITVQNYEAYLLDWIEGNLSSEDALALDAFFEQHPELDERELLSNDLPTLELVDIPEYDKVALFKGVTPVGKWNASNYEDGLIREIEGDLEPEEQITLHQFVNQDESLIKEYKLYQQVQLEPDLSITAQKESLIKSAPLISIRKVIVGLSAAASLALLFSIGLSWNKGNTVPQYAERTASLNFPAFEFVQSNFVVNKTVLDQSVLVEQPVELYEDSEGIEVNLHKEYALSLDPLRSSELMVDGSRELTIKFEEYQSSTQKVLPAEGERLFADNFIDRAKQFLFKKSSEGINKAEQVIMNTAEPIIGSVDNSVAYEQTSNESRKSWRFALGPIEINRVTYQ